MYITFIGNCQTVGLCIYFQDILKNDTSSWLLYGEEFHGHIVQKWTEKCHNKIMEYEKSIEQIKNSDVIIFQEIVKEKSLFSNTETLKSLKKESCKIIKIPSINLDYDNYDESLKELQERENMNNVDIKVSTIFEKYRLKNAEKKLMFTSNHPKTLLFLEILNEIFLLLNIESLSLEMENCIDYKNNENYVGLP